MVTITEGSPTGATLSESSDNSPSVLGIIGDTPIDTTTAILCGIVVFVYISNWLLGSVIGWGAKRQFQILAESLVQQLLALSFTSYLLFITESLLNNAPSSASEMVTSISKSLRMVFVLLIFMSFAFTVQLLQLMHVRTCVLICASLVICV
jgi:ABC-type multidrug transport system fused ATPase/permease subunit